MATADDLVAATQSPVPALSDADENVLLGIESGVEKMDVGDDTLSTTLSQALPDTKPVGDGVARSPAGPSDPVTSPTKVVTVGAPDGSVVADDLSKPGQPEVSKPEVIPTEDGSDPKPKPSAAKKKKKKKKDRRPAGSDSEPSAVSEEKSDSSNEQADSWVMKESAKSRKNRAREARIAYASGLTDRPDKTVESLIGVDGKYHLPPAFGDDGSDDEDWLVPGSHPIDWYVSRITQYREERLGI